MMEVNAAPRRRVAKAAEAHQFRHHPSAGYAYAVRRTSLAGADSVGKMRDFRCAPTKRRSRRCPTAPHREKMPCRRS